MQLICGSQQNFNLMMQFCTLNNLTPVQRESKNLLENRMRYLHLLKDCDELVVYNYNGYIGASSTAEIALALSWGKKVSYVFDFPLEDDVKCLHQFFDAQAHIFNMEHMVILD